MTAETKNIQRLSTKGSFALGESKNQIGFLAIVIV